MAIQGLNKVISNLKKAKGTIGRDIGRGLKRGGLYLQRKSMGFVPVQLGVLKASSFCRNVGGMGFDTDVIVGYTANYAVYVHEDLNKAHGMQFNEKYAAEIAAAQGTPRGTAQGGMFQRGKDQQAKFLERPAREERGAIILIVQNEAKF